MNDVDELLDTEYIDVECQNDSFNEYDFDNEEIKSKDSENFDTFDEMKLKQNRYMSIEGKKRFLRSECSILEFSRTPISFYAEKLEKDFSGIVMKEVDSTHFYFLVENPETPNQKKIKKFDISDISIYF